MKIHLASTIGHSVKVLPHMLNHYRSLGINSFILSVHLSHPADNFLHDIENVTRRFGIEISTVTVGDWQELEQSIYRQAMQKHPNDWFILADQDELQTYPKDIHEILAECEDEGYDFVAGCLVDRLSEDGSFPEVETTRSIWEQFPLGSMITWTLECANPRKVVAAKGYVEVEQGQHGVIRGRGCPVEKYFIPVHHFKWVNGIIEELEQRVEKFRQKGISHWIESQRFISHCQQHGGKIDLSNSDFMIAKCDPDYTYWEEVRSSSLGTTKFAEFE